MIEYGGIQLRLLGGYDLTKASQVVSFSNIKADFTGHDSSNLPQKYQECKIYTHGKLKFVGFINGYSFREMREKDKYLEIEFELLSPMALATVRTQMATGNYTLKNLINFVFEPLVDDGFTLEEVNITDRKVTVNYVWQTIEYIMSDLSSDYNLWWFIDENKKIYVKDIELMLNSKPQHIYDNSHRIEGLEYIKPTILSQDYANVINFTNVRTYQPSYWDSNYPNENLNPLINEQVSNLTNGTEILFNHPVDISPSNIIKAGNEIEREQSVDLTALEIKGKYNDNTEFDLFISYDRATEQLVTSNNFDFEGDKDSDKDFLLIRDSFFSNLIVGFKYNGNKTITMFDQIFSISALVWSINKFYNDSEIAKQKGKITETGIVEMTIDMNEQWKTISELSDIGNSYVGKTSLSLDGQLEIAIDENIFKVGDIIKIDKMLFNGNYIFTSIKETYNNNHSRYIAICKNINVKDNYIDLFRDKTTQENSDKVFNTYITHYSQDEIIKESHEVVQ